MKAKILNLEGSSGEDIELPKAFETPIKALVIRRAVLSEESAMRQPKGRFLLAGVEASVEASRPGHHRSRTPRTRGGRMHAANRGAFVPQAVGGRAAFPPKVEKIIYEKINKKERRLALKSAIAATGKIDLVKARGHRFDEKAAFPLIIDDAFLEVDKTKNASSILEKVGCGEDLKRVRDGIGIRCGKCKIRGRGTKTPKGPLIVIPTKVSGIFRGARNIPGVDIVSVKDLMVRHLAPGTHYGRLTIWTKSSLEELKEL